MLIYINYQITTKTGLQVRLLPHDRPLAIVQSWPTKDHAKLHVRPANEPLKNTANVLPASTVVHSASNNRYEPIATAEQWSLVAKKLERVHSKDYKSNRKSGKRKSNQCESSLTHSIPDVITHDSNKNIQVRKLPSVAKSLLPTSKDNDKQHSIIPKPPKRTSLIGSNVNENTNTKEALENEPYTRCNEETDHLNHIYCNSDFLERAGLTQKRSGADATDGRNPSGISGKNKADDIPPSPPLRAPRIPIKRKVGLLYTKK